MAEYSILGTGTLTLGETPVDFSGEVLNAAVQHEYEDIGDARTMLDGTTRAGSRKRTDGFTADVENDLTATGLYQYLVNNDLTEVAFEFTPNTDDGAVWSGTVIASLPSEIGADEYGNPIVSTVELTAVGTFTFTPAT